MQIRKLLNIVWLQYISPCPHSRTTMLPNPNRNGCTNDFMCVRVRVRVFRLPITPSCIVLHHKFRFIHLINIELNIYFLIKTYWQRQSWATAANDIMISLTVGLQYVRQVLRSIHTLGEICRCKNWCTVYSGWNGNRLATRYSHSSCNFSHYFCSDTTTHFQRACTLTRCFPPHFFSVFSNWINRYCS